MALLHSHTKETGRTAPDFTLPCVDGHQYSLSHYQEKKWIAVIFTCNHCPYAIASWDTILDLVQTYPDIWFFCISSNNAALVPADGFDQMKSLSDSSHFPFPYLYDEDQSVAKAYNAQCTPDNYLFKNTWTALELFFHGRFNDNRQDPSLVTKKDFEAHINKLLNNQEPDQKQYPSMGCSIKRK